MQLKFSDRLRLVMEQRGLGAGDLAKGVGVARQSVYNWLANDRITRKKLEHLSVFLGVAPEWLQYGGGADPLTGGDGGEVGGPWSRARANLMAQVLRNEQRLNFATQAANIAIWEYEILADRLAWSGDTQHLIGEGDDGLPATLEAFFERVAEPYRPGVEERLARLLSEGGTERAEFPLLDPDGENLWVSASTSQQRDSQGRVSGLVGVLVDISGLKATENLMSLNEDLVEAMVERKRVEGRLRRAESLYRTLFSHAGVGLIVVSPEGRIQEANEIFAEFIGYEPGELAGMDTKLLTHPDDRPVTLAQLARVRDGTIDHFKLEKRCLSKGGEARWGRLSLSAVRDEEGAVTALMGVVTEIGGARG